MIFKCKMCGGDMEYKQGASVMECPYCGTNQTLPKVDDERLAQMHSRANHLRLMKEFDKAQMIYEEIIAENPKDAEAHWCALLCRYGIEYVEDPYSHERKPTMHRTQFDAITEDAHYLSAVEHADSVAREMYEHEAQLIDRIRRRYLSIASKEEPFDVFICYKETGENGQRTKDSVYAQEIYNELIREGYKVFFARITLEDKLGEAYEPYIFAALGSAKVMLVVGTSAAHMQAEWVKNEWKRYLYLMKQDSKKKLIPVYRDMEAYDMPEEFVYMQAQDYGKIGALQDLVRGVEKIAGKKQALQPATAPVQQVMQQTVVQQQGAGVESLMRRAQLFLEDGDWKSANEYLNKVLDINPEYAPAYFGKVMAKYAVRKEAQFAQSDAVRDSRFEMEPDWQKVLRFADAAQKQVYVGYFAQIQQRRAEKAESERKEKEAARIRRILEMANHRLCQANTIGKCEEIKESLKEIQEDSRAQKLIKECDQQIKKIKEEETLRILETVNKRLGRANTIEEYEIVKGSLKEIPNDPRAQKLLQECDQQIERIKASAYDEALACMQLAESSIQIREASQRFFALSGYRDSQKLAQECEEKEKEVIRIEKERAEAEQRAEEERREQQRLIDERNRQIEAAKAKKRNMLIAVSCLAVIAFIGLYLKVLAPMMQYQKAEKLLAEGKYVRAKMEFEDLVWDYDYKDSSVRVKEIAYTLAEKLLEDGLYDFASEGITVGGEWDEFDECEYAAKLFAKVGQYRDAEERRIETYFKAAEKAIEQGEKLRAVLLYRRSGTAEGKQIASELMTLGRIVAGGQNAIGLDANGSIISTGNVNMRNPDGWNDIVSISAAGSNIVATKVDGTLVTLGHFYNWNAINNWTDIKQVATGINHTVGLKTDGTLVANGKNTYGECDVGEWNDIVSIAVGAYHTAGLKSDGTVVAIGFDYHGTCDVDGWNDIVEIAAGKNYTVGLRSDGSVFSAGKGNNRTLAGDWVNIVAIAAGYTHAVGLRADGTVVAIGDNQYGECNVKEWRSIIAVAAGDGFTLGLKDDGTVIATGNNQYGQCNVKEWNLLN